MTRRASWRAGLAGQPLFAAVTIAGPVGFVGLCAPVITGQLRPFAPSPATSPTWLGGNSGTRWRSCSTSGCPGAS
ncbi:MAG: hypothetical protein ACJ72N_20755 [Labedaea sp.]